MKANELMIGDWVLCDINAQSDYEFDNVNYQPYQIENGEDIDYSIEKNMIGDDDVYQPMPLTKEILEKNGFKQIGKKFIWGEIDDDFIEITPSINNSYRIKVSVADLRISCSIWCSYVHQLQHALRLCGIEKTIELSTTHD